MDRLNAVVEALGGPRVLKKLEHNRWAVLMIVIISVLILSCSLLRPKVVNPLDPGGEKLDRAGLQALSAQWTIEMEAQGKLLMSADEALREKEAWVSEVISTVEPLAVASAGPWGSLVTIGFGLLTGGLLLDNRRKGQIIKKSNGQG